MQTQQRHPPASPRLPVDVSSLLLSTYHVGSGFAHVGWYGHHFPPDQYGSDRSMALRLNGTTRLMCATTIEGVIIARSIVRRMVEMCVCVSVGRMQYM